MATKNTTKQIVVGEIPWKNWLHILKARAQDLAGDSDHTFKYRDRDRINQAVTRRQIVTIYETAYSELAESFVGHLERIDELFAENSNLKQSVSGLEQIVARSNERLETASRRINGLLRLIELPLVPPHD